MLAPVLDDRLRLVQADTLQRLGDGPGIRRVYVDRPGQSFYLLRHGFSTWAQELGDIDAVNLIMGHSEGESIRTGYRHGFPPERLLRVTDHVRGKVFGKRRPK